MHMTSFTVKSLCSSVIQLVGTGYVDLVVVPVGQTRFVTDIDGLVPAKCQSLETSRIATLRGHGGATQRPKLYTMTTTTTYMRIVNLSYLSCSLYVTKHEG